MTRHKDSNVNLLLRSWNLRGHRDATLSAYEVDDFDELMAYFADAHRGHGIQDYSVRYHRVTHARTGETVPIDLADTLLGLRYLQPDEGEVPYAAAAMRYTYTAKPRPQWFERMKKADLDTVHEFLDARRAGLRDRTSIHVFLDAVRDGVDAGYVGSLPLYPEDSGYSAQEITELWQADTPAEYAAVLRVPTPTRNREPFTPHEISMLHRSGVTAGYAAAFNYRRDVSTTLRFHREGIPSEFALEL